MNKDQDRTSLTALNEMSDEQLRLLIAAEMDAEVVNVELVRRATAVLASREEDEANEIDILSSADILQRAKAGGPALFPEVAEEMEHSIAESETRKPLRHSRLFKTVLVAAVIVTLLLGSSIAAGAAGLDLRDVVAKWSADVFGYSREGTSFKGGHVGETNNYLLLKEFLVNYGVTNQIIPRYTPENYVLVDSGAEESYEGTLVYGIFSNGKNRILLRCLISNVKQPNRFYAIDDAPVEQYVIHDIVHYIMTNEDEFVVSWINGNVFCDISGVQTHEDAIKMIDSIYEEES